jgi:hypothetical protein
VRWAEILTENARPERMIVASIRAKATLSGAAREAQADAPGVHLIRRHLFRVRSVMGASRPRAAFAHRGRGRLRHPPLRLRSPACASRADGADVGQTSGVMHEADAPPGG